ncbi:MAG: hypothetical protein NTW08_01325 [Gammaproteobacteria bacterium]|nr:hypothetical protein [Gammaproteobacteria bacterium]
MPEFQSTLTATESRQIAYDRSLQRDSIGIMHYLCAYISQDIDVAVREALTSDISANLRYYNLLCSALLLKNQTFTRQVEFAIRKQQVRCVEQLENEEALSACIAKLIEFSPDEMLNEALNVNLPTSRNAYWARLCNILLQNMLYIDLALPSFRFQVTNDLITRVAQQPISDEKRKQYVILSLKNAFCRCLSNNDRIANMMCSQAALIDNVFFKTMATRYLKDSRVDERFKEHLIEIMKRFHLTFTSESRFSHYPYSFLTNKTPVASVAAAITPGPL